MRGKPNCVSAVVACGVLCGVNTASADEIHVYEGDSIQAAILAASDDDEIIVHQGMYVEMVDPLGKSITVRSLDPLDPYVVENTVIHGYGSLHTLQCVSGEGPDTVISGFTITGGDADGDGEDGNGGGVFCTDSSPAIDNCVITANASRWGGGGLYCLRSSLRLTDCLVTDNFVGYSFGGGLAIVESPNPTVVNCTIDGNGADSAGGLFCHSSALTMISCSISENIAESGSGGGMTCMESEATFVDCRFVGNTADGDGGGMDIAFPPNPTLINCLIAANSAGNWGGGVVAEINSCPMLINCTIAANNAEQGGGGLFCWFDSYPEFVNSIIRNESEPELLADSAPHITYSNVKGGWEGLGNIDADPLFVEPEDGDYHLSSGSPCIDAANNDAVPGDVLTDLDDNPRFVDDPETEDTGFGDPPIVDMGCYEFQVDDCPADITGDEIVNVLDLLALLGAWGPCPDCPEDITGDGVVDVLDLLEILGAWGPCQSA